MTWILFSLVPNPLRKLLMKSIEIKPVKFCFIYRSGEKKIPSVTQSQFKNNTTSARIAAIVFNSIFRVASIIKALQIAHRTLKFNDLIYLFRTLQNMVIRQRKAKHWLNHENSPLYVKESSAQPEARQAQSESESGYLTTVKRGGGQPLQDHIDNAMAAMQEEDQLLGSRAVTLPVRSKARSKRAPMSLGVTPAIAKV